MFKFELAKAIDVRRQAYKNKPDTQTTAKSSIATSHNQKFPNRIDERVLNGFTQSKQLEGLIQLTTKQMLQRFGKLLVFIKG